VPTNPGDTQFPTALPTPDTLFRVVNFDTSTSLDTTITSGSLSIILTDASLYPASGAIKIDDEIIFYTSKASNTLTIPASGGRGADGSTAAAHSAGATVRAVAIARHHMVLAEEIAALAAKMGTGADTPANGEVLISSGAGVSGWRTLAESDVANLAADLVTLAAGIAASQPLDADLTAIAALGSTGFAARTASNTWAQRTFSNSSSITWTNPGGVAGDPSAAVNQGFSPTWTGIHIYSPTARSSGSSPYLTINAPADTNLTVDTEAIGVSFVGATRQHADGTTQTNQREYVFAFPTYSAIVALGLLVGVGTVRSLSNPTGTPHIASFAEVENLTLFLILRSFAAGCSAVARTRSTAHCSPSVCVPLTAPATT